MHLFPRIMFCKAVKVSLVSFLILLLKIRLVEASSAYLDLNVTGSYLLTRPENFSRLVVTVPKTSFQTPGNNWEDLLVTTPLLTLARGVPGAQQDLSIRGSTFEQVLVLLDGIPLNDPQTGHHHADLPFLPSWLSQVEVIPGPASPVYGSGGFSGVVNFLPRFSFSGKELGLGWGDFGLQDYWFQQGIQRENWRSNSGIAFTANNGYQRDTELAALNFFNATDYQGKKACGRFYWGFQAKDFGAYDFFTPGMGLPSEENIRLYLGATRWRFPLSTFSWLNTRLYWRGEDDEFILDEDNPDYYQNRHFSQNWALNAEWGFPRFLWGGEVGREAIRSNRLANHQINRLASYMEFLFPCERFTVQVNGRWDYAISRGNQPSLSSGLVYPLFPGFRFRVNAGSSFRNPSFTDLYYFSRENRGNPDLVAERVSSAECGWDWQGSRGLIATTFYQRWEKDLIDWVKVTKEDTYWQATNIGRFRVNGNETILSYGKKKDWEGRLTYQVFFPHRIDEYYSKYQPRQREDYWGGTIQVSPFKGYSFNWTTFWHRRQIEPYFKHSFTGIYNFNGVKFWAQISNLSDCADSPLPGVPSPGRWFKSGFTFSW